MSSKLLAASVLAVLAVTACAPAEPEASADTGDLTRSLLSQPAGPGGMSTPVVQSQIPEQEQRSVEDLGYNRGSSDAPVKVVEMSDYGCGYCRQFHEETFPTLLEEYIEAGIVEWKFMPYITGMFENSLVATEAAECTYVQDTGAFEVLNSRLWGNQSDWKGSDEPEPLVRGWVSELGIDMETFDSCIEDNPQIERIFAATALAGQLGVRGTPTFLVMGYAPVQGALPLETFRELLDLVHEEVTGQTAGQ
jgi:protein-disulfide isomerase